MILRKKNVPKMLLLPRVPRKKEEKMARDFGSKMAHKTETENIILTEPK